ncbi:hypothetical protein N7E81_09705 [Reichenbachiella carrageenanivorans]|uniref:Phosphate-selective porin O and P n=1 Tax=Reichenbachiella carrageenanivorans TaxID=2979869 RepID=A0ABY6CXX1_9BACT|nr:hypothetical protein [Reichenbachiella carrageenanivorans]UXX77643.1 hypothetical protein N7E81_09705 [Reichenbachiella carrageenanivorans]
MSEQARGQESDSSSYTNLEAIFNRPFIYEAQRGVSSASVGGYVEGNTNYFSTDGVSDGFSMELRRFNIFLFAAVHERIKFISELEFEHGTEEIALETALLDFEIHPAFVFRMGILLPPIGYFNQNHDSPKWDFIDRPLVSTQVIPSTLSEMGFGFYGKVPVGRHKITYELYLTNGLSDGIIENAKNRTFLGAGKSEEMFAEDNNGTPALSSRFAFSVLDLGEFGVSGYTGIYNTFKMEGEFIDEKRRVSLLALDCNFNLAKLKFVSETAWVFVQVPDDYGQQFGHRQFGIHLDMIYPIMKRDFLGWAGVTLNLINRLEYVDYNWDNLESTGTKIYDETYAIVPGLSLRFSSSTLLRFNYRRQWDRDFLGNPASKTAGIQFGFASYF